MVNADYPVSCCNLGIREETILALQDRVEVELLRSLHPDLAPRVIISAGTNDTAIVGGRRRVTEKESLVALRRFIEAVRGHAPLLLVGPPALAAIAEDPVAVARFLGVMAGSVPVAEFFGAPVEETAAA